MPAKKPKTDEKPQIERFIETARAAETDESQEAFDAAFERVVVKHKNILKTIKESE